MVTHSPFIIIITDKNYLSKQATRSTLPLVMKGKIIKKNVCCFWAFTGVLTFHDEHQDVALENITLELSVGWDILAPIVKQHVIEHCLHSTGMKPQLQLV